MKKTLFFSASITIFISTLLLSDAAFAIANSSTNANLEKTKKEVNELLKKEAEITQKISKNKKLKKSKVQEIHKKAQKIAELQKKIDVLLSIKYEIEQKQNPIRDNIRKSLQEITLLNIENDTIPRKYFLKKISDRLMEKYDKYRAELKEAESIHTDILEKQVELETSFFEIRKSFDQIQSEEKQNTDKLNDTHAALDEMKKKIDNIISSQISKKHSGSAQESIFERMKGLMQMPAKGKIAAAFGKRYDKKQNLHSFHNGIEISTKPNQPVTSVAEGKLAFVGSVKTLGTIAIIEHDNEYFTIYGNLGLINKNIGDNVSRSEQIGTTNNNGTALYFEIRKKHTAINPSSWFSSF